MRLELFYKIITNERWTVDGFFSYWNICKCFLLWRYQLAQEQSQPVFHLLQQQCQVLYSPQTDAILNFDFTVTDDANTTSGNDALPTLITQIVIPQGAGNDVANWTQAIIGAQLSDGTNTITGTINASTI